MFDAANYNGQQTPADRRGHQRQRTLLQGKLVSLNNSVTGDCTIRNLSSTGAKLAGPGLDRLPDNPILLVTKTGLAHEAVPVWGGAREIGVRFQVTHDLSRTTSSRLAHVYRLWVESLPR